MNRTKSSIDVGALDGGDRLVFLTHAGLRINKKSRQGLPDGLGLILRKTYTRFRRRLTMTNSPRAARVRVEGSGRVVKL